MPARKPKEPSVLEKALREEENTPHTGTPAVSPTGTLQTVRVNLYEIVSRAVEEGARYGLRRTWKHREGCPPDEVLDDAAVRVVDGVMGALCEVLSFDEE